jgi:hypothetical protein
MPEEPPGPKKKNRLPPILMVIVLGAAILALGRFYPSLNEQLASDDLSRTDIQVLDGSVWNDTLTHTFAMYAEMKKAGYDLDRGRVEQKDTLRYCEEALDFLVIQQEGIEELASREERGNAPAYLQACVGFLSAARDLVLALRTEAEKDLETEKVSLDAFEERIKDGDARIEDVREIRIAFLTPGMTEEQLEDAINAMDVLLRTIK